MRVIRFIWEAGKRPILTTVAISTLSGLFNMALIAIVHRALVDGASGTLGLSFVVAGVGKLVTGYYSEVLLTEQAQRSLARMRIELATRLLQISHRSFVAIGPARIHTALTQDLGTLSRTLQALPAFLVNIAILVGGGLYLVYLSWVAVLSLAALGALGGLVYRQVTRRARSAMNEARHLHDELVGHIVTLTGGFKELKLHRGRRRAYVEQHLRATSERLVQTSVVSHSRYIFAHSTTHLFLFALIGVVVFAVPQLTSVSLEALTGYVLTCLYLMGPLSGAVRVLPQFASAELALGRIEALGVELSGEPHEAAAPTTRASFHEVALRGVTRRYWNERHGESFTLGPIDLTLRPGETVFITGSNGSGKSTLARLLTGLDRPDGGIIEWDGTAITDDNRDEYRQLFSTVFADFFLFDTLLGLDGADLDKRAAAHLGDLQLDHKVSVSEGVLSTTELSAGQRKRLALLTAYLEDRPIYLFDEWAADQDPEFKRIFYHQLLPELRGLGKAVIVITHDDRYFGLADRRIRLGDGRMLEDVL